MIYDGIELEDYFRIQYEFPLILPSQVEGIKVSGRPGKLFTGNTMDELSIPMEFRLKNRARDDLPAFRRLYRAMLHQDAPRPLYLPEDQGAYRLGIFQAVGNLDTLWYTGKGTLDFIAPDPIAYGDWHDIAVSGTRYDGKYFGTWPTYPVIEAWPANGTSFTVWDHLTGFSVTVNGKFNGSQHVVIDCERQQTTINGTNAKVTFESDYPHMAPGDGQDPHPVDLRFSHEGVILKWRDRWQ